MVAVVVGEDHIGGPMAGELSRLLGYELRSFGSGEALDHQDDLQTLYTGGTVFHGFLGESIEDWKACRNLVKAIATNYRLPYFTISPIYSICPVHGYLKGEYFECPKCHKNKENEIKVKIKALESERKVILNKMQGAGA